MKVATRCSSNSLVCTVIVLLTSVLMPYRALACETTRVTIQGNLDSRIALIESLPSLTAPASEQFIAAQAAVSFQVFDSVGQSHSMAAVFYRTGQQAWASRVLIMDNTLEFAPGSQIVIGSSNIIFNEDGSREVFPSFDLADTIVPLLQWRGGGLSREMLIIFQVSNEPHSTALAVLQDGSSGGCPQFGGLDFDGDGRDDFAIWRPSIGMWAILKSSVANAEVLWKQWGLPGDYPMPGDYTGDGKADLVVWRPSNGTWYVCKSDVDFDCSQSMIVQFGLPGDEPLEGDYDGDRVRDFAVWRRSTGTFFFRSSFNTAVTERQWGLSGDIPLQAGRSR